MSEGDLVDRPIMRVRRNQKLNVRQFLKVYEGSEDKVELIDGEVWLMAGGSQRHSDVAVNLIAALSQRLRGTGCRPYNSDMGVFIDVENMRYPDVTVTCDPRDLEQDRAAAQLLHHPGIIFEVLSPTTAGDDSTFKAQQYRRIPSVRMIVLVDPLAETLSGFERTGTDEWRDFALGKGADLALPGLPLTLTAEEIFAR